jgi:hypothetical protein
MIKDRISHTQLLLLLLKFTWHIEIGSPNGDTAWGDFLRIKKREESGHSVTAVWPFGMPHWE